MSNQILLLLKKEFTLEWRLKFAFSGILLYLATTIFIVYLSFILRGNFINPNTWNTLFWIVILFTGVNGIAKSFLQESQNRSLYYYGITNAQSIIVSKLVYNALLMLVLGLVGIAFYSLILGSPIINYPLFLTNLFIASIGLSSGLTMISAIASQANNNFTLMAILGFPVLIPLLLLSLKISSYALIGLGFSEAWEELVTTGAIIMIIASVSLVLFPYLWRL